MCPRFDGGLVGSVTVGVFVGGEYDLVDALHVPLCFLIHAM